MAQPSLIRVFYPPYAGGVALSPAGRTYSESAELIAREDRSADGTLRRDVAASKKTFTLSYASIDDAALSVFDALYNNHASAVLRLEVTHIDFVRTYNVLMKAFSRQRVLAVSGGLWENVTVEFSEV